MSIKHEIIPVEIIKDLDFVFENKTIKNCFKEGMWIAGGFPRQIGKLLFGNIKKSFTINHITKYFNDSKDISGDIDVFCKDISTVNKILKMHSSTNPAFRPSFWDSNFANNITYFTELKNKKNVFNSFMGSYVNLKIQIVSSFFFDSIKECFESFDITNCKYAISKNKNHYILTYDSDALKYDYINNIHISHSNTPFLARRISKYLNREKSLSISNDKCTLKNFKDYLYKMASNNWSEIFDIDENLLKSHIVRLNNIKPFTDLELSLFVGKISCSISQLQKINEDYGIFVNDIKKVDWASSMINKRV